MILFKTAVIKKPAEADYTVAEISTVKKRITQND